MYEDYSPELIQKRITDRVDTPLMTGEGSFFELHTKPVAYVLSEFYHKLDAAIPIAFVDETSGEYLVRRAAEFGIERKPGYRATVTLTLTGQAGCSVPAGTAFQTADGLVFTTLRSTALADAGSVDVPASAEAIGAIYNVPAGAISRPVQAVSKLDTVTNADAAEGGMDEETDEALFRRLDAFRREPATSGNRYHYEHWAMEVNGVGAAKCIEVWDGPGTVKVIIADMEIHPVTEEVRQAVADYIETQRTVCADVTVESAQGVQIDVSADVQLSSAVTLQSVQKAFQAALEGYIAKTVFENPYLSFNRIAYLLMSVDGVLDYTALTVNGAADNIDLPLGQVPVLERVEVTAGA